MPQPTDLEARLNYTMLQPPQKRTETRVSLRLEVLLHQLLVYTCVHYSSNYVKVNFPLDTCIGGAQTDGKENNAVSIETICSLLLGSLLQVYPIKFKCIQHGA